MTLQAFIAKWHGNALTEKAGHRCILKTCARCWASSRRVLKANNQYERGLIKKSSASQGWAEDMPVMPDTEMLKRLLALNLDCARLEI